MSNLQSINCTVDEVTPDMRITPSDAFEAIGEVTVNYLWDYWPGALQGGEIETPYSIPHGVLRVDTYYIEEFNADAAVNEDGTGTTLTDYSTFNPLLTKPYSYYTTPRIGTLKFTTCASSVINPDTGDWIGDFPELTWKLVEAAPATRCRNVFNFFGESDFTYRTTSCMLKFLGIPSCDNSYAGLQSYVAYFANTPEWPNCFYLLGVIPYISNRIDPTIGDFVYPAEGAFLNALKASEWWYSFQDSMLYVKYYDHAITSTEGE